MDWYVALMIACLLANPLMAAVDIWLLTHRPGHASTAAAAGALRAERTFGLSPRRQDLAELADSLDREPPAQ